MKETWREKSDKYFEGELKLFEESYKFTYPCRYKKNGKWRKAKIDINNHIVYGLDGRILRKC